GGRDSCFVPSTGDNDSRGPVDGSNAGPLTVFTNPLNRRRTSAAAVGLRASLPLKITSSILSPRRLLALCSPITHVMASRALLLPHPLGPTMAVTPLSKASSERSENDLKPLISRRSKRMRDPCPWRNADCGLRIYRGVRTSAINQQSAIGTPQ